MTEKDWRLKPLDILKKIEGLKLEVATETLGWFNYEVRPVEVNGTTQICTRDHKRNRVNVVVNDGIITEVRNLG